MFAILLAAASALVWGTADFSGGKAAQRWAPLAVTVVSQLLCLPALLACLLLVPGVAHRADLAWGAAAGLAGFAGIVLLYRALSAGAMAVVAPLTAVTAALVPVLAGLVIDRFPGVWALTGAGLAVVAIALVSLGPGGVRGVVTARLIGIAVLSGVCFGLFFVLLGQTAQAAGMWPLAAGRLSSVLVGVLLMLRAGLSLRAPRPVWGWVLAAGTLDVLANALFLAAAFRGHLSIVSAVAALYPTSTVLLALLVDRERLRPVQLAGLGLAAAALVLAST